MGNILACGMLEAITIVLRKHRDKNSNKVQVCLVITSEVTVCKNNFKYNRLANHSIYIHVTYFRNSSEVELLRHV